ncbi:2-keto-4-pentenoate hydratase [Paludisphaera borealis]|uniref:2-keto-4-pentenoate hydratase n=1 Tax=Paludisphaera borealis TaxID=1387353 RepID=A0A1U7CKN5_9BACT|nr:fumarylacetoacetate hydrolase family protein [Paludisphaera borealis]APW59491.1 2-keto-4-pentenoate hydratase [Paludisphaera borealis]
MTSDAPKNMDHLQRLADAFLGIFQEHRCDGRSDVPIGSLSLDDAYEIQRRVVAARVARGERVVGYKVGCTSRAIRRQFGLAEPIRGRLMAPHVHHGDTTLDWRAYHRPAIEPEFVLTIGRDLTDEVGDEESLIDAIDCVSPGVEVHNYRFWLGEPTSQELIASNGIHAALVVGDRKRKPQGLDWEMEGVGVWLDGELAASGIGAEIMGGPLASLRWLVNHLVRRGEVLRAGELVIPGSPVGLISVEPGERVTARFTNVGRVEAEFRGDR